jgi:hypothetical protein
MSAVIRAKMFVNTVNKVDHGHQSDPNYNVQQEVVKLGAVYSSKEGSANAAWAKATPAGHLELTIDNPGAHGILKAGQWYYVDLIPCEKDSP